MNFALVSKLLSVIMLILAIAFAICLGVSYLMDAQTQASICQEAFSASIATALFSAGLLYWVGRNASPKFFKKEALCTIGLGWILASVVGSIPYTIIHPEMGISGAIFESVSGITTTGASVLSNLESLPYSLLFWRGLSQWIGGMGVVVFFVAILGFLGASGKILYSNEASGSTADFEESRVQSAVTRIIYVYSGLSLACTLSFKLAGMTWYEALCHMFATLSTGGFSTRSESIGAFNSPLIEWVTIFFMIAGGVSFLLILKVIHGKFHFVSRSTEFIAYLFILVICTAIVSIDLTFQYDITSAEKSIRMAAFQVVSIMTTTGFATEDFAQWPTLPQLTLLLLMVIGGCSGSTSGGVKVFRIVIALRVCMRSIEHAFRSRIVRQISMNNRVLGEPSINDIMVFLVLTAFISQGAIAIVSIFEPSQELDTNISAVIATLLNIGPGLADIGPQENFSFFHGHTKIFLSLLMIMGRLELYAILALFAPSLWKKFD
ncbi:TrkH family potassium uptake protein [Puniceicoccaceae bacterium K14]|nr:TrkH family potassium uptake protein [Puniceicoccaceae bacterium K14]